MIVSETMVSMRLPRELARQATKSARAIGLSRSQLMRRALAEYLKNSRQEGQQNGNQDASPAGHSMEHMVIDCNETCKCGNPATHKITEDEASVFDKSGQVVRHPFTTYVCCRCFSAIFGPVAARSCGITNRS